MSTINVNKSTNHKVTEINGTPVAEYVMKLSDESVWNYDKHAFTDRHFNDMLTTHIAYVLTHHGINVNDHKITRGELAAFLHPDRRRDAEASAREIVYSLTDNDLQLTLGEITGIVSGDLSLRGNESVLTMCHSCGARLAIELCGNSLSVVGYPCDEVGYYETNVSFPTGRVVIGDYIQDAQLLIEMKHESKTENYDMESDASHRDISARLARGGMYHVFVGNSCPSIIDDRKRDVITIGNHGYDDETYEPTNLIEGVELDSICTDLWWASMIDMRNYKKILKDAWGWRKGSQIFKRTTTGKYAYDIIEIPPGDYVGKSFHHIDGYPDDGAAHIMATLTKVK